MKRGPVFKGHLALENADTQGETKELQLPYLAHVVDAYAVTIDNSATGNVSLSVKILNQEVFSKTDGSGSYSKWVELATVNLEEDEAGTLLLNGLFIGEGSKMAFTLGDSPSADYDVYVTIREVL